MLNALFKSFFRIAIAAKKIVFSMNKNKDIRKAVVITDMRLISLAMALDIYEKAEADCLLISDEVIKSQEYGSKSPTLYKMLKVFLIKIFYPLEIIKNSKKEKFLLLRGVYSSLISETRDALASAEKYPDKYANFYRQSVGAQSVCCALNEKNIDVVYLFNGRLSSSYLIYRNALRSDIDVWFYEWGNIPFHYTIQAYRIHDLSEKARQVIRIYENPKLLSSYYYRMRNADNIINEKLNNSFAKKYGDEELPECRYDVSIFLSSPHELCTIDGLDVYSDVEFCRMVVKKYGSEKRYAIRAHPNMQRDPSCQRLSDFLKEYADAIGADYYSPDNNISSYKIIECSSFVVTYYSSISVDAYFLGAKVDVWAECAFKLFIDYCEGLNISILERQKTLAKLLDLSKHVNQECFHPKWYVVFKLLSKIDKTFIGFSG